MSSTNAVPDPIAEFERETPEPKLELIAGRLVVGNSLAGSRYILRDLLTGWGTEAALAFAPAPLWKAALRQGFAPLAPPDVRADLAAWQAWADTAVHEPTLAPAGPFVTGPHHWTRERLNTSAWHACGAGGFGKTLGRDFVMRLGDDGLTPDGSLIGRQATDRLFERYLCGSADVVWEVLIPGRERQDREVKRRLYESGGVPHYWTIDPQAQTVELLRLVDGRYERETLDADGRYRPPAVPGLAFVPARLWQESSTRDVGVFEVESPMPKGWTHKPQPGIAWDDIPFDPRPELEPTPVSFDEFAAWCPRAKFEADGRTIVGGYRGTRNVLGMLLRTFGLTEAVRVLHPRAWVAGLGRVETAERGDAERKARWWNLAREAAARLRSRYQLPRIAVIGALTSSRPLHFWSELSLVVWELPGGTYDAFHLLRDLDTESVLHLIDPEHATATEQRLIADGAIDFP